MIDLWMRFKRDYRCSKLCFNWNKIKIINAFYALVELKEFCFFTRKKQLYIQTLFSWIQVSASNKFQVKSSVTVNFFVQAQYKFYRKVFFQCPSHVANFESEIEYNLMMSPTDIYVFVQYNNKLHLHLQLPTPNKCRWSCKRIVKCCIRRARFIFQFGSRLAALIIV